MEDRVSANQTGPDDVVSPLAYQLDCSGDLYPSVNDFYSHGGVFITEEKTVTKSEVFPPVDQFYCDNEVYLLINGSDDWSEVSSPQMNQFNNPDEVTLQFDSPKEVTPSMKQFDKVQ